MEGKFEVLDSNGDVFPDNDDAMAHVDAVVDHTLETEALGLDDPYGRPSVYEVSAQILLDDIALYRHRGWPSIT